MSPTAPSSSSSSSSSPSSSSKRGSGKGTPRNKGIAVTAYKRWESDSKHAIVDPSRIPRAASNDNSSSSQILSDLLSAIPPAAAVSVVFHALNRTHHHHNQHSMAGRLRPQDQQPPSSLPAADDQFTQHISAFFSQLPATLVSLFIPTPPAPSAAAIPVSTKDTNQIPPQSQTQPHMSSVLEHHGREHHPSYLADAEGYCVTDEVSIYLYI